MKYLVISQSRIDERVFKLKDENGETFDVDFYTGGEVSYPIGADASPESWNEWLRTFIGKTLEIEEIVPYLYFTSGKVVLTN